MANIKTRALKEGEYSLIIQTIQEGLITADGRQIKLNIRIATALVVQANLGLRIGDIVNLQLSDIVKDGNRYRLNIKEQKTGKIREFTVVNQVLTYLQSYALDNNIKPNQKLFSITVRQIQKHLKIVIEHLGLESIGTHSFRNFFAVSIYNENDYNIELVRQLLQHSTVAVTQHYLSVQPQIVEKALQNHIKLPK
ncbi:tyrosine-type recombinase/integrase [Tissierella pigra]|uniref:Tyrosine-type recombinase/integrase n=1 Tax=Tissierella pigra TaxID=2607614 RepID=A0A6N7Y028_9FIRM|nr:tyrosine-type recombinase/integrase [Tissierella pigra]MBU5427693.1 tyrosine-type recombinase/integrase [Tissierella pigra]MSU03447.1 tyrosine-type recombinase/integrase [Tissierella pigra]